MNNELICSTCQREDQENKGNEGKIGGARAIIWRWRLKTENTPEAERHNRYMRGCYNQHQLNLHTPSTSFPESVCTSLNFVFSFRFNRTFVWFFDVNIPM